MSNIRSHNIYRATRNIVDSNATPYEYLEIMDVDDLGTFLDDLQHHPMAQEIGSQVGKFTTVITDTDGILIPRVAKS